MVDHLKSENFEILFHDSCTFVFYTEPEVKAFECSMILILQDPKEFRNFFQKSCDQCIFWDT